MILELCNEKRDINMKLSSILDTVWTDGVHSYGEWWRSVEGTLLRENTGVKREFGLRRFDCNAAGRSW